MLPPTNNFIKWYKNCCDLDMGIYRVIKYKKSKAKIVFNAFSNLDFIIYPLDGTQKIFCGSKNLCEQNIQENLNKKFLIFSFKDDTEKGYVILNESVKII